MLRRTGLNVLSIVALSTPAIASQISLPALSSTYGYSIAASESTLVVGDPHADAGSGSVWIYIQRSSGAWERSLTFRGEPGDSLGYSLGMDAHHIVAGAPGNRKVYLYNWHTGLVAPPIDSIGQHLDGCGDAVDVHGVMLFVGCPAHQQGNGQVEIYVRTSQNEWVWMQSLQSESMGEKFGHSLAVDSENLLIGAPEAYEPRGERAGLVYRYQRSSGSDWILSAELRGGMAGPGHKFGSSLTLGMHGRLVYAIVGAPGASLAYIYQLDPNNSLLTDTFTPIPSVQYTQSGVSVGLLDGYAIVGTPSSSLTQRGITWILSLDERGVVTDRIRLEGAMGFGHAIATGQNFYAISELGSSVQIIHNKNYLLSRSSPADPIFVEAYPNPFRHSITLSLPDNAPNKFFIIDPMGRLVQTLARHGQNQIQWVPPDGLAAGYYVILFGSTAVPVLRLP